MDDRQAPDGHEWLEAQQKYWDAWLELTRRSFDAAGAEQEASGADAVRQWWDAAARAAPPATRELFGRLVDLSAPYFEMAQTLSRGTAQESAAVAQAWLAGMQAEQRQAPGAPLWDLPLDAGAHVLSALLPLPGNPWQAAKTDVLTQVQARLKQNAERLLALPAVGYSREAQEQYQQLGRRLLAYAQALQEYNLGLAHLGERSAANLERRLEADADTGPVESLRQLYDLCVDACEEEYAAYAMSDEYARRYAGLVGALAALKRQTTELLDETLDVMNLPTRREIDALQRRSQEARRAEQRLRAQLGELKRRVPEPSAPARASKGRGGRGHAKPRRTSATRRKSKPR